MLSSYTLLGGRAPLPGKLSRAALQPRKQPAASVALPCVPIPCIKQSRPPRFVCYAQKNTYNIQPGALVRPSSSPKLEGDNWSITVDKDHINLKFNVGELTSKDNLEVALEDQVLLVIRYTGDPNDNSPASKLDVRLLMPLGYGGTQEKVKAMITAGWLQITIAKPKHEPYKIQIS